MKTVRCPDCNGKVRPCNLERHRRTHLPYAEDVWWGTRWYPAKRPLLQGHDIRRYDVVAPRGEGRDRFRIYRLRGGLLELLGTTATQAEYGIALFALYHEGEFLADDSRGVLDTLNDPGDWIVHPWALGRTIRTKVAA